MIPRWITSATLTCAACVSVSNGPDASATTVTLILPSCVPISSSSCVLLLRPRASCRASVWNVKTDC
uniref:Uncharacterized protein n=1 Tax=Arundo donax TaxID=35708 RepID=A0A0A8Z1K7_ARUDO